MAFLQGGQWGPEPCQLEIELADEQVFQGTLPHACRYMPAVWRIYLKLHGFANQPMAGCL